MYDGTCREKYQEDPDIPFCIRLKTPNEGETSFHDLLAGEITFQNNQIDDMIIRRTDGSPTYNLCVAIDDIDMQISHVIRGNDHLSITQKHNQCLFPAYISSIAYTIYSLQILIIYMTEYLRNE